MISHLRRAAGALLVFVCVAFVGAFPAIAQFADQAIFGGNGAGTANAQTVQIANVSALADIVGVKIIYLPSASNTSASPTLAISGLAAQTVKKISQSGAVGIDVADLEVGVPAMVMYDGTNLWLLNPANTASLSKTNQSVSGGATGIPVNLGNISGSFTPNCGNGQFQFFTNVGAITLNALANTSACSFYIINSPTAGSINVAAYIQPPNFGDAYVTTNGATFYFTLVNINGTLFYFSKRIT